MESLKSFDGTDAENPVLVAYEGQVYDVTDCFMWLNGRHFWHRAGRCFTRRDLAEAPHGEEMLQRARRVGRLGGDGA